MALVIAPKPGLCDVRTITLSTDGMVSDQADGKLYAGVVDGVNTNCIISIDPVTGTTGKAVSLDALPSKMVISSNGQYVYSVIANKNQISRYNTQTQAVDLQWSMNTGLDTHYADDLVCIPGSPGSIAVSRANYGVSPRQEDVVIYDDGVNRPSPQKEAGANLLDVNTAGTRLYGYQPELSSFDFCRWDIGSNGLTNRTVIHPIAYNAEFKCVANLVYFSNGVIVDPESGVQKGTFSSLSSQMTLPDPSTGRLFTAAQNGDTLTIKAQNLKTLAPIGTLVIPDVGDNPGRLVRWGTNGLAFRTPTKIFLVRDIIVGGDPPIISSFTPHQGFAGQTVVFTGQKFSTTYSVKLDGYDCSYVVDSDTQLTVTVPDGPASGPFTISAVGGATDSDPFTVFTSGTPTLSVGNFSVPEGNSGTKTASFPVTLSGAIDKDVTFTATVTAGTATAGQDYTATTTTVTIPSGQTTATVDVNIMGDTASEADETLNLTLSNVTNAASGQITAVGTILNDDSPSLTIAPVQVTEGNTGTTDLVFTATLSTPSAQTVGYTYTTADGTAVAGADYTTLSGMGSFAPGQLSQTFTVKVKGDLLDEPNETVLLKLSGITGAATTSAQATGTIADDDAAPKLSVADVSVTEGNSGIVNAYFLVTLSGPSGQPVTVNYATSDDSANSDDYTSQSGTLIFSPGQTSKPTAIPVNGDTIAEGNDKFHFNLTGPVNATISRATAVGTILDDDTVATLTVSPGTASESAKSINFTAKLSVARNTAVTFNFDPVAITAKSEEDYVPGGGTVTIPAGALNGTFRVNLVNDNVHEPTETFKVNLTSVKGAQQASSSVIGTIIDDDPQPTISIGDLTVVEGKIASTNIRFYAKLSRPSSVPITVKFATQDGTAIAPGDYTSRSGTLTIKPGSPGATLDIAIRGDVNNELTEQFRVNLSDPTSATLSKGTATCTILDTDPIPNITVVRGSVMEGNGDTVQMPFTVNLSQASGQTVTLTYATAPMDGDSATAGVDYIVVPPTKLTFLPGEKSKTVNVSIKGDILNEADERFSLVLSSAVNAKITGDTIKATGTILNDDAKPTLSIDDVSVAEGNSGLTKANFTVTLSAPSGREVSFDFSTLRVTASSTSDFNGLSGSYTFQPGETSKTISIEIKGDTTIEPDEQFKVVLSKSVNANFTKSEGVGTIANDDISSNQS